MPEYDEFESLRNDRVWYVEAARKNDFEDGLKSLLSELYPDNAHFIYELLQNAEDALATTVEFSLGHDRLTVSHNGRRPFTIADIESITGIGKSTKKDDPTQIGKFGVGFKAVFAYTTRPEIRSGAYSFAIDNLFIPTTIDGTAPPGRTTFTFPFDRPEKPAAIARAEVERGLLDLNEKTVLFLNNIDTITFELSDAAIGIIERRPIGSGAIAIMRSKGGDFVETQWLRLSGSASIDGPSTSPLTVAAAFKIDTAERRRSPRSQRRADKNDDPRRSIVPVDDGDVSIYFPAVNEYSGLRFHIHAPFASTVARDSVRDDPGNARLVEDIAKLIADALPKMRDDGLIDDNFLATLPNVDDPIGDQYYPIRDAVVEAFNDCAITPVRGTGAGFASARTLVTSPSEFRNWLEPTDLAVLFELASIDAEVAPRWVRDRDGRAGKFLAGLETIEFGWDQLSDALGAAEDADAVRADDDDEYDASEKATAETWFAWLDAKSDDALLRVYQLLGFGGWNDMLYCAFDDIPIVRLRKRGTVSHVCGADTYLPSSRSDTVQARVPAELAYFDDDDDVARVANLTAFYRAVGTRRWDESARAERRLVAYADRDRPIPEGDDISQHLDDIRAFVRYAASQPTVRSQLANRPIFLADQSQGGQRWVSAKETFVDLPFDNTGLSSLYPRVLLYWKGGRYAYDQAPYSLSGLYLEIDGIVEFVKSIGSMAGVSITQALPALNPEFVPSWRNDNRVTTHGRRFDWTIEHLDAIITTGDHDLLRTLWHTVVAAPSSKAVAVYQANASVRANQMTSRLAQTLSTKPWVLDQDGDLRLPREMSIEDLPMDWQVPQPTSLVYKLGFGADAVRRQQKEDGISAILREEGLEEDALDILREAKEQGLDLRAILREHAAMARFPDGPSEDPVRRAATVALDAAAAPDHTTSVRQRSIVDGQSQASAESRAYLREQYTTETGEMHCQACRRPLPFKTREGHWYFEAVRLVTARKQVHTSNAVAFCPLCAAFYKYARATKNEAILDQFANTTIDAHQGSVDIEVILNGKRVRVTFTGKHAVDVKTSLQVAGIERPES